MSRASTWPFMASAVHRDPLDVEHFRLIETVDAQEAEPAITESYWQRGFNDARAGREPKLPTRDGPHGTANRGYLNGFRAGRGEE